MNRTLKDALWLGLVVVVPGLGVALLAKALWKDLDEKQKFREYVHRTYGYASSFQKEHDLD